MNINGSSDDGIKIASINIEPPLREFVRAIVREEMGKDWPKVEEAEATNVLSDEQWKDQQKIAKAAEAGDTSVLSDEQWSDLKTVASRGVDDFEATMNATVVASEDDSPETDAVPTMEDAVSRAKEVMTEDGGKARLKTALSAVGATRVSAIPEDKIAEFMEALDD